MSDPGASRVVRDLVGLLLTGLTALATVWVFEHAAHRGVAPLIFLLVLALIARGFGTLATFLGTLLAAVIFAWFLFPPVGSIHIGDADARRALLWMLMLGLVIADFVPAILRSNARRR